MKRLSIIALTAALVLPQMAEAKTVSGVELADNMMIAEQQLALNGAGVRSKFFMDLYVGSLYLATPATNVDAVIAQPISVIRLNITSGMITADKMTDAIVEGFDAATNGDSASIQSSIDAFMGLFNEEVSKGDQFTFVTHKDAGVTSFKNGQEQATIANEAFRQALIKIWLGDEPAQKSLRKNMLAK
ncbi:chalcone isomerase family protein [Shewanella sp. 3_MG-2023]|uniref:chalcone isomerase family protein n=1 Tax=Shewanella sp. 3_MG-2023 TaxID=3062635 RepID=UPI0026E43A05|nr:chalcone isomerase family protein [Shewanella sp. 3_MG-2023]MDO6774791.1 chalcone isomerase family protein [Shewanella sp. 3_MG-2023]